MARTAGESLSWLMLGGLGALGLVQPFGCAETAADTPLPPILLDLLADVGPDVVQPALAEFGTRADALAAATAAWAAAPADDTLRTAAQDAWREATASWQVLEMLQVGPAGSSLTVPGGRDLRDAIYSWPTVSPCAVDQTLVAGTFDGPDFFASAQVTVTGLDALEYLLFHAGPDNACPSQVDLNANGTWDALDADTLQATRAAYAEVLASRLVIVGDELQTAWQGDEGFSSALAGPDAPFADARSAVDAVFQAFFYLESATKEAKLARPLGLRDCTGAECADEVEAPWSGASLDLMAANLDGFEALFTGGEGTGFDDVLVELGHSDLAVEVAAELQLTRTALAAVSGPLSEAIRTNPDSVRAVYDAIDELMDELKGDVATVLSLQIPSEAAGDND